MYSSCAVVWLIVKHAVNIATTPKTGIKHKLLSIHEVEHCKQGEHYCEWPLLKQTEEHGISASYIFSCWNMRHCTQRVYKQTAMPAKYTAT